MQLGSGIAAAVIGQHRNGIDAFPCVWLIHLPVDDFAESLRRVDEGGGEVIQTFAEDGYAIIRDPLGVYLALQNAH
ncbi:MAG: hypothetical protein NXI32_11750 [bacterium]|nr:hypothetical protein [bacterium]